MLKGLKVSNQTTEATSSFCVFHCLPTLTSLCPFFASFYFSFSFSRLRVYVLRISVVRAHR